MESSTYNFEFYPKESERKYTNDVRLSFDAYDDMTVEDMCSMFYSFLIALGYRPVSIKKYINLE